MFEIKSEPVSFLIDLKPQSRVYCHHRAQCIATTVQLSPEPGQTVGLPASSRGASSTYRGLKIVGLAKYDLWPKYAYCAF